MKTNKKSLLLLAAVVIASFALGRSCSNSQPGTRNLELDTSSAPEVKFWTCSMHPQIKQPGPGKCPLCAMDLIPVMASDETAPEGLRELKLSANALALAEVETVPVTRDFARAEVRMVGKVEYDETGLSYLTAWVPGRLDRLFVDYTGVEVKTGDHMVSLYSPELLAAQEELLQSLDSVRKMQGSGNAPVLSRAEASVEASREKLKLWGLTAEQVAAIETRGAAEDHMTIFAPVSGTVIHKNAFEGDYVKTGTRIYSIADLSRVWVKLDAYESDLAWLHYGQDVSFTVEAYPGKSFMGKVAFIDPMLNPSTRTVKVRVNVDNADGLLKPEMFVRAKVISNIAQGGKVYSSELAGKWISPMHPEVVKEGPGTCDVCGMALVPAEELGYVLGDKREAPLLIPVTAVLATGKRAVVYVKSPDREGVFEGREIVLGARAGKHYLVRRGLEEGEWVVAQGAFKLDAELQIHAKPSMMTPEGGGGGGGHNHGGAPMAAEGQDAPAMDGLSSLSKRELHAVLAAAASAIAAVNNEDLHAVHGTFAELATAVDAVSADVLQGHSALLWKEYAMFIGNDAVLGGEVHNLSEARAVAAELKTHVASMSKQMMLSHSDHDGHSMPDEPVVDPRFNVQLAGFTAAYLELQNALSNDDFERSRAAAEVAQDRLSNIDMTLVSEESHRLWMKQSEAMKSSLTTMAAAADIDEARVSFSPLSKALVASLKQFGVSGPSLYQHTCPMALDGEGAFWIQKDKATRNPYYGASMLTCGSVVDAFAGEESKEGHHHE